MEEKYYIHSARTERSAQFRALICSTEQKKIIEIEPQTAKEAGKIEVKMKIWEYRIPPTHTYARTDRINKNR